MEFSITGHRKTFWQWLEMHIDCNKNSLWDIDPGITSCSFAAAAPGIDKVMYPKHYKNSNESCTFAVLQQFGLLKCGFCKKLLLYECNSDQLPTFFIPSSLLDGFAVAPTQMWWQNEKKWATGQRCIRKEVPSYKIHTLVQYWFFCYSKFQLFWEGHKNLRHHPYGFDVY